MQNMRNDERMLKVLTERNGAISDIGENRLDNVSNIETRAELERAMTAVDRLAYRAGPISEALDNGAKTYKETGRLKDAAETVADAIRDELRRNGFDGGGNGARGPDAKSESAGTPPPNLFEGFEPGSEAARAQIDNTRISLDEEPLTEASLPAGWQDIEIEAVVEDGGLTVTARSAEIRTDAEADGSAIDTGDGDVTIHFDAGEFEISDGSGQTVAIRAGEVQDAIKRRRATARGLLECLSG